MATTCARCGTDGPQTRFVPPERWIQHLTDDRDLDGPPGEPVLALCHGCKGAVTFLVEYERVMHPGLGKWAQRVSDRRNEFLEEFEAPEFVDGGRRERVGDPEHGRSPP